MNQHDEIDSLNVAERISYENLSKHSNVVCRLK